MHPFFKPRRARSSVPISTPFQKAGQVWDERSGLALAHARNWRRLAVANLVLAGFLGAGWWRQRGSLIIVDGVIDRAELRLGKRRPVQIVRLAEAAP